MNYFRRMPHSSESNIHLHQVFAHFSRTTEVAIERGQTLMFLSKSSGFRDADLADLIRSIGKQIVEDTETARGEMLLLYLSQRQSGLPDRFFAPEYMFRHRNRG